MTDLGALALSSQVYTAAEVDALLAAISPGMVLVETQELGAAGQFDFDDLPDPADFAHLRLIIEGRGAVAADVDSAYMRLNANADDDYIYQYQYVRAGSGSAASASLTAGLLCNLPAANASAAFRGHARTMIPNYGNSVGGAIWHTYGGGRWPSVIEQWVCFGRHESLTDPITRIQIGCSATLANNFAAGSIASLYALAR